MPMFLCAARAFAFCFVLVGLSSCGGGGGGPVTTSLSVSSPSAVASASLTQGSAFAGSTGNYGLATSIDMDAYSGSGPRCCVLLSYKPPSC